MDELDNEMKEIFGIMGRSMGFKQPMVKMLAVLYLEPREVAMDKLAERTGYSLASVSNTMRTLESVGVVKKIKKPGTKKIFYFMEKNLMKLNMQKIDKALSSYVMPAKKRMPGVIEKFEKKVDDKKSREKLKIMKDYYRQMVRFEKILKGWKKDLENMSR